MGVKQDIAPLTGSKVVAVHDSTVAARINDVWVIGVECDGPRLTTAYVLPMLLGIKRVHISPSRY